MSENKSSISNSTSYEGMAEFWDSHDTADFWEQMETVEFEINLTQNRHYFALETNLAKEVGHLAQNHGVSTETLLNLWIQQKLLEEKMVHSIKPPVLISEPV